MPFISHNRLRQRGSLLGLSAVSILAIMGAVSLAVDISHLYLVSAELQNAADAAALAGASALNGGPNGISNGTNGAVERAIAAMNRFEFNRVALGLTANDVTFAQNLSNFTNNTQVWDVNAARTNAANVRFVRVIVPAQAITTLVGQVFLQAALSNDGGPAPNFAVSRAAVAGQVGINSVCNFVPFAIVEDGQPSLSLIPDAVCTNSAANRRTFTRGCTYTATLNSGQGSTVRGGDFVLLNNTSSRANDVRARMAIGVDGCASVGTVVTRDTGTSAGQVRQGLDTRFDEYGANLSPSLYPPDANVKENITYTQYSTSVIGDSTFQQPRIANRPGLADRRVLVLPILNAIQIQNGQPITIQRFGAFFMKQRPANGSGGVTLEFINNNVVLGNGGFVPGGGGSFDGLKVPVLFQ